MWKEQKNFVSRQLVIPHYEREMEYVELWAGRVEDASTYKSTFFLFHPICIQSLAEPVLVYICNNNNNLDGHDIQQAHHQYIVKYLAIGHVC